MVTESKVRARKEVDGPTEGVDFREVSFDSNSNLTDRGSIRLEAGMEEVGAGDVPRRRMICLEIWRVEVTPRGFAREAEERFDVDTRRETVAGAFLVLEGVRAAADDGEACGGGLASRPG